MYSYNIDNLKSAFAVIIRDNIMPEPFSWLTEKITSTNNANEFNTLFVTLPRKTGKSVINLTRDQSDSLAKIRERLTIKNWTADRFARVFLLLHLQAGDREKYFRSVEELFLAAEVNELVALYSALPLFAYPGMWVARCSEGIRNNIADVLKAIMCNNPYPSERLDEAAWNQMVLKAFFTDKPIEEIIGLDERRNERLARTLSDYAHERWAAHRPVNPQLWRCVGPFIDEQILPDIKRILASDNILEKQAGSLAIYSSKYNPAKELLPEDSKNAIESGKLSWKTLADKMNDYVLQQ